MLSVNCPRRMIDLDGVHQEETESEIQKVRNRELKRFRQLLLEIEKVTNVDAFMDIKMKSQPPRVNIVFFFKDICNVPRN